MGKHNYPANRRSPHFHKVTSYIDKHGRYVPTHTRGKGAQLPQRSRVVGDEHTDMGEEIAWVANITYDDGSGESILLFADTYAKAQEEAFEERSVGKMPKSVELVDPSLDEVLTFLSSKGKSAAKLGAKYGVIALKGGVKLGAQAVGGVARGAKVGIREAGRLALYEADKARVRLLLTQAYSDNKIERNAARVALKRNFPEIWSMCSFSRR